MANIDKGVLFNYEWIEACKGLSNDDFATLFFAIASYQKDGTPFPEFDGTLKIISTLILPCVKNRVESAIFGKQGAITRWENNPISPPISPPISQDKISKDKISKDKINNPPLNIPPFDKGECKRKSIKKIELLFAEFWKEYPKKANKQGALKCYIKINPSRELHESIIASLKAQKHSKQWQDVQYIPYASTWLNREQWNDEQDVPNYNTMQAGTTTDIEKFINEL